MAKQRMFLALVVLTAAVFVTASLRAANGGYTLLAWNNLGMHCMDSDFSIFSILPPFNTVQAQLIDANGRLVKNAAGITMTFEAVADPSGSINSTSADKTNFWQYVQVLFGSPLVADSGLAGFNMPTRANRPQRMNFDSASSLFSAEGIPITSYDDAGQKNYYPLMHLVARDSRDNILAATDIVLPVSDEMDCRSCHASGSPPAAQPSSGWMRNGDPERDYRLNILLLHDQLNAGSATYAGALKAAGYGSGGLYATVSDGKISILCARCHESEALPGTGMSGIPPLTRAVHRLHAGVIDPTNGQTLDSISNRSACYRCHPGSETRCLRGAMGSAVAADGSMAMQCQNCHGNMSAVGDAGRTGWLNEPNCQSCHTGTAVQNSGQIRFVSVFEPSGKYRIPVNILFATTPNVPVVGASLFRASRGHGGLVCSACHGSTHAEFPATHQNDNLHSLQTQGHVGVISECATCHNAQPNTISGGPHGMHPVGQQWVSNHDGAAEGNASRCQACHGADYRGTVLSRSFADRNLSTRFGTKQFWRGFQIGCYTCHSGPSSESANPNRPPQALSASVKTGSSTPLPVQLIATDPDGNPLTLRIVSQPSGGTVALNGTMATYYPSKGFAGKDSFTFAAWDGMVQSNLGTITIGVVTRLYIPFYQAGPSTYTGFAISNFSNSNASLTLTAHDTDGHVLTFPRNPATFLLSPQTQLARLGSEIFGADAGALQSGWVQAETDNPDVGSFFQFGSARQLDGSVAISQPSKHLLFTRVWEGIQAFKGQTATTYLSIANPTDQPISLSLSLAGLQATSGTPQTAARNIPGKGFLFESVSKLFGANSSVSGGYIDVQVTKGDGAVGFELILFPDRETALGLNAAAESGANLLYSAQLASGESYFTNLKLVNASTAGRSVEVRATAENGSTLAAPVKLNLGPGQSLEQDVATVFGFSGKGLITGSLSIIADGPGVTGDVVFGDPVAMSFAAALPLQTSSFNHAVFSQVANGQNYFTGLALYNPNPLSASVTIDVYSETGAKTGQLQAPLQLGAGNRLSRLLTELIPATAGQMRGFVILRSTKPLIAQQVFGDTGMNFLSAVPPTAIK